MDGAPLMRLLRQKDETETPERDALVMRLSAVSGRGKAEISNYAVPEERDPSPLPKRVFK